MNQKSAAELRFAKAGAKAAKYVKEKEARYRIQKIAMDLAPVFRVSLSEIRAIWNECIDPVQELYDSCMPELRVYMGASIKMSTVVTAICHTPVWDFLISHVKNENPYPVITFRIKGQKKPWVLTAKAAPASVVFEPRIVVPVKGTYSNVFIMPMDTFIKEYTDG